MYSVDTQAVGSRYEDNAVWQAVGDDRKREARDESEWGDDDEVLRQFPLEVSNFAVIFRISKKNLLN